MKKLVLNTSDLNVESFETGSPSEVAGTIKGNQEKCANTSTIDTISAFSDDCLPTQLIRTCAPSCGGSCMFTCAITCESLDICQVTGDDCEPSTL